MRELIEAYKRKHVPGLRMKTNVTKMIDRYFPPLYEHDRHEISAREIAPWLEEIGDRYPTVARNCLKILRSMFNKAILGWGMHRGPNPCYGLKLRKGRRHLRYVLDHELPRLQKVLNRHHLPFCKAYYYTIMYTAARRNEALDMMWDQIMPNGLLAVYQPKTDKTRLVMVPDFLLALLSRLPRYGKYIFSNENGEALSEAWAERNWIIIRAAAGIEDVRLHDLRHTVASHMGIADENSFTIRDALGHASIQTTEIYTHLNDTKVNAAYSKWHDKLAAVNRELDKEAKSGTLDILRRFGT